MGQTSACPTPSLVASVLRSRERSGSPPREMPRHPRPGQAEKHYRPNSSCLISIMWTAIGQQTGLTAPILTLITAHYRRDSGVAGGVGSRFAAGRRQEIG